MQLIVKHMYVPFYNSFSILLSQNALIVYSFTFSIRIIEFFSKTRHTWYDFNNSKKDKLCFR